MTELSRVVLGYWDIRGLAEPIRYSEKDCKKRFVTDQCACPSFLLEYTGITYEDRRYVQGDAPGYSREQWLKEKVRVQH
jgi:glutathione S-transferase